MIAPPTVAPLWFLLALNGMLTMLLGVCLRIICDWVADLLTPED